MRLGRAGFLAAFTLLFAACTPAVPPAEQYATVGGTVSDVAGKPLPGATVTVNGVLSAVTDANGKFSVYPVPIGPWSYTVTAAGFKPVSNSAPVSLLPAEKRTLLVTVTHI